MGARTRVLAPLLFAVLALAACESGPFGDPRSEADRMAAANRWQRADHTVGPFVLRGYQRFDAPGGGDLAVYIESDGLAWIDRYELSSDPTPVRAFMLGLAVRDPSPNRAYIARPCQYLPSQALGACSPIYWTSGRFAPEVVAAIDAAVAEAKRRSGAARVSLFGFSGGGAIAALLAARRTDVARLVTVAATLDHARWTSDDDVSPLSRSLNPADEARALQAVPQVHFVGLRDRVVPPAVVESYVARMTDRSRVTIVRIPDFRHECCWEDDWRSLVDRYVYGAAPSAVR
jgi:hypothetical protein